MSDLTYIAFITANLPLKILFDINEWLKSIEIDYIIKNNKHAIFDRTIYGGQKVKVSMVSQGLEEAWEFHNWLRFFLDLYL